MITCCLKFRKARYKCSLFPRFLLLFFFTVVYINTVTYYATACLLCSQTNELRFRSIWNTLIHLFFEKSNFSMHTHRTRHLVCLTQLNWFIQYKAMCESPTGCKPAFSRWRKQNNYRCIFIIHNSEGRTSVETTQNKPLL